MRQILETLAGVKSVHRNSREEAARRAGAVHRILRTLKVVRRRGSEKRAGTQMEYAKGGGNFVRTTAASMLAWNVAGRAFASTSVEKRIA